MAVITRGRGAQIPGDPDGERTALAAISGVSQVQGLPGAAREVTA
jgi:hypothetical protein